MSGELVGLIAGAVLSMALEIVPGLSKLWENWEWKRGAWLGGCLAVAFGAMGLCYAGAPVGFECVGPFMWDGFWAAGSAAFAAYFAGQFTYVVVSRRLSVRH